MQRITEFAGAIQSVIERIQQGLCSIPAGADLCPFCKHPHRLRRHGTYKRTAVTADEVLCVLVLRLLCAATGHTVSLLPDALLPRKQHAIAVIAEFFTAWSFRGLSLAASMAQATKSYPSRQKGAYWIRCLLGNLPTIHAYLASVRPRQTAPPSSPGRLRARVAHVLTILRESFHSLPAAFRFHSRSLHARFGRALL